MCGDVNEIQDEEVFYQKVCHRLRLESRPFGFEIDMNKLLITDVTNTDFSILGDKVREVNGKSHDILNLLKHEKPPLMIQFQKANMILDGNWRLEDLNYTLVCTIDKECVNWTKGGSQKLQWHSQTRLSIVRKSGELILGEVYCTIGRIEWNDGEVWISESNYKRKIKSTDPKIVARNTRSNRSLRVSLSLTSDVSEEKVEDHRQKITDHCSCFE